jgi:ketosteroid isomerase-like protein
MSEENVELLREMYGRSSFEEFARSLHTAAELHQSRTLPDADDYYGRDEFIRGAERWMEGWDEFRYRPEEFIDLGGTRALIRVRVSGRARTSGIQLDLEVFHLWTFRNGMPWRLETFLEKQAALESAGVSE